MRFFIPSAFALLLSMQAVLAGPLGTAFTYQGRLQDAGQPANGKYDFEFTLYNDATDAARSGGPITNRDVLVADGVFMVTLDFGDVFTGSDYWLEIGVRTNGDVNAFAGLKPRQAILPGPVSIFSRNAGSAAVALSVAATNVTGVVPFSNLPDDIALLGGGANFSRVTSSNFYGGEIMVTSNFSFSFAGGNSPITLSATNYLSPFGYGGASPTLNFGLDKTNRVFISERVVQDEFVNNPSPVASGVLGIYGPNGDQLAFTHFRYGAEIAFRNSARELEIHGYNGNFYTPLMTLLPGSPQFGYINEVQIRNPFDTNSIIFKYPALAAPSITTEFPGTDLGVLPQGQLLLGSLGIAQWAVTNGNLVPVADNTYDIGVTNGFRPRNLTLAGGLSVAGSITTGITHLTNNYTLGPGDSTVIVDVGGLTVSLPSATGITGRKYIIKNGPGASSVIRALVPQTIDGEPVIALNFPYQLVSVQSDGVQWWIISSPEP